MMPTSRERAEPCYTSDYVNRIGQTVKIVHYMLCCTDCGALVPVSRVEYQPAPTWARCPTCREKHRSAAGPSQPTQQHGVNCYDCGTPLIRRRPIGKPAPAKSFCSTCWADRLREANGYRWDAYRLPRPEAHASAVAGSAG